MSLKIKSITDSKANGVGLPVAEAPKMTAVQNALVQSALSRVTFAPALEPKKEEIARDAMNLKKTTLSNVLASSPSFQLGLTNQELRLLDSMFQRWALYNRICLYELVALDLYTDLVQLGKYLPKEPMSVILESFCAEFAMSYVSICAENTKDKCSVLLEFAKPGVKTTQRVFVVSREHSERSLAQIKESLLLLGSAKKRLSSVSSHLNSVSKKLDLLKRLLLHPEAMNLLTGFNLFAHAEKFPGSKALNSDSPHKTLEDLIQYAQFLDTSFSCGVKKGFLGIQAITLHDLAEQLGAASKKGNLFQAIKQFKREFSPRYLHMEDCIAGLRRDSKAAGLGQITPDEYYQQHNTPLVANKSPQEFASQLFANLMTIGLVVQFTYDVFEILDEQVMAPLYPEIYIPTSACLTRFNINFETALAQAGQLLDQAGQAKNLTLLPVALSDTQQTALRALLNRADLGSFFVPRLITLPLEEYYVNLHTFNTQSDGRFHFHLWLPFIKSVEPCVKLMMEITHELAERRAIFLGDVEKFLRSLDPVELRGRRQQWIDFFREFCFQNSLDVCRWTMIAQDIQAISQIHVNLAVVNSEEHLLPEALVDYMDCEGIEELFNKLLYPPQNPMHEDLEDKPVRVQAPTEGVTRPASTPPKMAPVREKLEGKQNRQQERAPVEERSPSAFVIRRGEKTRRILSRLRELGFLPVSKRGSHQKLEGKEGQSVIIPTGGKRKHQKRGTAASITSQANGQS